jgi:hypothetical protein
MNDDYRDSLGAAQSRIEALERENAALKDLQNGRPATAAEVEAVRLETELFRADTAWDTKLRTRVGSPRNRTAARLAVVLGLCFPLLGVLAGFAQHAPNSSGIGFLGLSLFAIIVGAGALLFVALRGARSDFARELAAHSQKRARVVEEIAKLRGGRVRVESEGGSLGEAEGIEESAPGEGTRSRMAR